MNDLLSYDLLKMWGNPNVRRIVAILIGWLIIWFFASMVKRTLPKYFKETDTRYKARKFVNFFGYFLLVFLILMVYSSELTGLSVFIGVAGAGIAFALQELIASVAGFVVINFSSFYKVGDRVMLGGIVGDVIDVGVFRTSMMQTGDWVKGDLYNGKIVRIANSFIFKEPVYNYSGEFPFLWDELTIPIRLQSDFDYAKEIFMSILNEVQGDFAKEATKYWDKMTESMMIENAQVEPMVTMSFDENWITFTLRYVVDFKKRRTTKDAIFQKALKEINESNKRIEVASTGMEITTFQGTQ